MYISFSKIHQWDLERVFKYVDLKLVPDSMSTTKTEVLEHQEANYENRRCKSSGGNDVFFYLTA
ncbi:MAG: hypothetical protein K940chlam8_01142 [Chlamydiae bacterium]|nr:hypothetical protein [Chlamydiota bacterium]